MSRFLVIPIVLLGLFSATVGSTQTSPAPPSPTVGSVPAANPQPASEEAVASSFEAAAPELVKKWMAENWVTFRDAANLGERGKSPAECQMPNSTWFYTFIECEGSEPTEYAIDVKKTDSILTPYLGIIRVPYKLACRSHHVVPRGISWSETAYRQMAASCLGKTYKECLAVGKDAPKSLGAACSGGPGTNFDFKDTLILTYKWSHGKWEFQKKEAALPAPPVK